MKPHITISTEAVPPSYFDLDVLVLYTCPFNQCLISTAEVLVLRLPSRHQAHTRRVTQTPTSKELLMSRKMAICDADAFRSIDYVPWNVLIVCR